MNSFFILFLVVVFFGDVQSPEEAEMKEREKTSFFIIHHSATLSGNVEIFRRYHVQKKDFDDVGYHFVITNGNGGENGKVEKGRKEHLQGAHAKGQNAQSIGICLVGEDEFAPQQVEALVFLLTDLCLKYGINPSSDTVLKHHDKCPGDGLPIYDIIMMTRDQIELRKKEEQKQIE